MTNGLTDGQKRLIAALTALNDELSPDSRPSGSQYGDAEWKSRALNGAGAVLHRSSSMEQSRTASESIDGVANRAWSLSQDRQAVENLPRQAVAEFGWAAMRVAAGAALGAALGGPFVAMALKEQVAEKVIEASIGGAIGAFANEVGNKLTKTPTRPERDAYIADLEMRIKGLERQAEAGRSAPDWELNLGRTLQRLREVREAERIRGDDRDRHFGWRHRDADRHRYADRHRGEQDRGHER